MRSSPINQPTGCGQRVAAEASATGNQLPRTTASLLPSSRAVRPSAASAPLLVANGAASCVIARAESLVGGSASVAQAYRGSCRRAARGPVPVPPCVLPNPAFQRTCLRQAAEGQRWAPQLSSVPLRPSDTEYHMTRFASLLLAFAATSVASPAESRCLPLLCAEPKQDCRCDLGRCRWRGCKHQRDRGGNWTNRRNPQ